MITNCLVYVSSGTLTLSLPILLRLHTFPYWSNPPFLIFDIRGLWHSGLSASARMSKIKNGGLDQYDAELFEQQQFGTAGVEELKRHFNTAETRRPLDYLFCITQITNCSFLSSIYLQFMLHCSCTEHILPAAILEQDHSELLE